MTEKRTAAQPVPQPRDWRAADEDNEAPATDSNDAASLRKRRSIWERLGQLIQLSPRGPFGT